MNKIVFCDLAVYYFFLKTGEHLRMNILNHIQKLLILIFSFLLLLFKCIHCIVESGTNGIFKLINLMSVTNFKFINDLLFDATNVLFKNSLVIVMQLYLIIYLLANSSLQIIFKSLLNFSLNQCIWFLSMLLIVIQLYIQILFALSDSFGQLIIQKLNFIIFLLLFLMKTNSCVFVEFHTFFVLYFNNTSEMGFEVAKLIWDGADVGGAAESGDAGDVVTGWESWSLVNVTVIKGFIS